MSNLQSLRQAIIEAVPEIVIANGAPTRANAEKICRPIGLEDVLRWMRTIATSKTPYFDIAAPLLGAWEMGLPLDQQPQEVIMFLSSLL